MKSDTITDKRLSDSKSTYNRHLAKAKKEGRVSVEPDKRGTIRHRDGGDVYDFRDERKTWSQIEKVQHDTYVTYGKLEGQMAKLANLEAETAKLRSVA